MIEEFQIRVTPRTAASNDEIVRSIAQNKHIAPSRIKGVRIIKRSIDARKRNVMVNLKVRTYIDEEVRQDYLIAPIEYKRVLQEEQMNKLRQKIADMQRDY